MNFAPNVHTAEFQVRPALPGDVDAMIELCSEHAQFERTRYESPGKAAHLSAALFDPQPRLFAWLALIEGRPVGYATASPVYSTWSACGYLHMDCLFVRSKQRRAGIGAALLECAVALARQQGYREMQWQTPDWNVHACRFYRRHGAVEQLKLRFVLGIS
jgi:GNAT superfamily N-acetyltransferase